MLLADADFHRPGFICQVVVAEPAGGTAEAASTPLPEAAPPAAPTQMHPNRAPDAADPWEGANRGLYGFHNFLDRIAIRPAAMVYKAVLPSPVRSGIRNFISNLDEPRVAINDILQGRLTKAGVSALRFAANTTIGVAGVFDPAKHVGWVHHDNDFGLTLGRTGHMNAGPYVFVPVLGPSSVRDLVGAGVDLALDPFNWVEYRHKDEVDTTLTIAGGLDTRVEVDPLLKQVNTTSIDPYATLRSLYTQSRESEVRGPVKVQDLPDFPDFGTPAPQPAQVSSLEPAH